MANDRETPATLAPKLGISQQKLRTWLRGLDSNHELVKHHRHGEKWFFSSQEAQLLLKLYQSQH